MLPSGLGTVVFTDGFVVTCGLVGPVVVILPAVVVDIACVVVVVDVFFIGCVVILIGVIVDVGVCFEFACVVIVVGCTAVHWSLLTPGLQT